MCEAWEAGQAAVWREDLRGSTAAVGVNISPRLLVHEVCHEVTRVQAEGRGEVQSDDVDCPVRVTQIDSLLTVVGSTFGGPQTERARSQEGRQPGVSCEGRLVLVCSGGALEVSQGVHTVFVLNVDQSEHHQVYGHCSHHYNDGVEAEIATFTLVCRLLRHPDGVEGVCAWRGAPRLARGQGRVFTAGGDRALSVVL